MSYSIQKTFETKSEEQLAAKSLNSSLTKLSSVDNMEITEQDLEHVCRVCMNGSGFLVDLFAEQKFPKLETSLVVKINECVEPQVRADDGMSKKICKSCIADVEAAYRLKTNYEQSFRSMSKVLWQSEDHEDVECIEVDVEGLKSEEEDTVEVESIDSQESLLEEISSLKRRRSPTKSKEPSPASSDMDYKPSTSQKSNAKGYTCRICSQVFVMKSELIAHKSIHVGERPYHCSHCPKDFGNVSDLKMHMRVHTGERPYKCSVCPKAFTQMSNLNRHLRVHNNDRIFKCPHCPKDFTDTTSLKTHVLLHSGKHPFGCPQCPKAFSNKANLNRHIRSHTGERPFVCPHCPTAFIQASNLNKHLKLHADKRSSI